MVHYALNYMLLENKSKDIVVLVANKMPQQYIENDWGIKLKLLGILLLLLPFK